MPRPKRLLSRHACKGDLLLRVFVVQCHAIRPVEHIRVRRSRRLWHRPLLLLMATISLWIGRIWNSGNAAPWIWNEDPPGLRRPVCDRKVNDVGCGELVGASLHRLRTSILRHSRLHILTACRNRKGQDAALKGGTPLADKAALRSRSRLRPWTGLWPWRRLWSWCRLWPWYPLRPCCSLWTWSRLWSRCRLCSRSRLWATTGRHAACKNRRKNPSGQAQNRVARPRRSKGIFHRNLLGFGGMRG
jgi:hypothetical protein